MQLTTDVTDTEDILEARSQGIAERILQEREREGFSVLLKAFPELEYEPKELIRFVTEELPGRDRWSLLFLTQNLTKHVPHVETLWQTPAGLLSIQAGSGLSIFGYGRAYAELRDEIDELTEAAAAFEAQPIDDRVQISTMTWSDGSPRRRSSRLRCSGVDDIAENYPPRTRAALRDLVQLLKAPQSDRQGKLALLHGHAGTGKTWALRALMKELHEHYRLHVIADPESFFTIPDYCLGVCSRSEHADSGDGQRGAGRKARPNLFLFEDAAAVATRNQDGDALSRFLNITEGILGAGRGDVYVLTFNEELGELDPAFVREGRCLGQIEFELFSPDEAAEWLRRHDCDAPPPDEFVSLASLYSLKADTRMSEVVEPEHPRVNRISTPPAPRRIGFAAEQK